MGITIAYNRVILVGNAGKDAVETNVPASSKVAEGFTVLEFPLVTEKKIKLADGTQEKQAQWHRISTVVPNAKNVAKGDRVLVEGELKYWKTETSHGTVVKGNVISIVRKSALKEAESQ